MSNSILDGKDDFIIYTPGCVDILMKSGEDVEKTRPIGGVCSTESLDRQEEQVIARGLDFSEFVKHGYYNDNHKQETAAILGVPRLAELRKSKWWTEGNLLCGYEPADKVWTLAKALQKSGLGRRLGFSIEGKVIERGFDNKVVRAKIRHVAITNSPVNTDCTWGVLAKAFGTREQVEAGELDALVMPPTRIVREDEVKQLLSFDEAVLHIRKARPSYSFELCERLAKLIIQQRDRRN